MTVWAIPVTHFVGEAIRVARRDLQRTVDLAIAAAVLFPDFKFHVHVLLVGCCPRQRPAGGYDLFFFLYIPKATIPGFY